MSRIRTNQANPVAIPGVQESLQSPGLVVSPPNYNRDAEQLMTALGIAGNLASDVGAYNRQREYEQRKEAAAMQDAAEKATAYNHGLAAQYAKMDHAPLVQLIKDGKVVPSADDADLPGQADEVLAEKMAALDPEVAQKYRENLAPSLIAALVTQREQIRAESRGENVALLSASAAAGDSKAVKSALDAAKRDYPELTDGDRMAQIVLPAAQAAAMEGDTKKLDETLAFLGDRFPVEQKRIRNQYAATIEGQRRQAIDAGDEQIADSFLDDPLDITREKVKALRPTLGGEWAKRKIDAIDAREKELISQNNAEALRQAKVKFESDSLTSALDTLERAEQTGGAMSIQDASAVMPDGSTHRIDRDKLIANAVNLKFSQLDRQTAAQAQSLQSDTSSSPDMTKARVAQAATANFNTKVKFLADTGAPYEPWSNLLNGGPAQINLESLSRTDGKGAPQIPAGVSASFGLWEQLGSNPTLRNRLTTNGRSRFLYSTAQMAKQYLVGDDTPKALLIAATATSDKDAWSEAISSMLNAGDLNDAADEIAADATNRQDVAREIENLARFAMSPALGLGPDKAVEWAKSQVKDHFTILNGVAVPTVGMHVPPQMPEIATALSGKYAADHPEQLASGDDFTLRPFGSDQWIIVNARDGTPVEDWQAAGLFNTRDLLGRYGKALVTDRAARKTRAQNAKTILEGERGSDRFHAEP